MKLTYSNPDGSMSVVVLAPDFAGSINDLVASLNLPEDTPVAIVDESDLPADRTFREAWRLGSDGIDQDIDVAKTIWRNKWRAARASLFQKLDTDMLRAIGSGDNAKMTEIEAKKQALRDVTQTALPNDITAIRAVWPEILN